MSGEESGGGTGGRGDRGAAESGAGPVAPERLKAALKAFKKRLKLTRLDDESRLGGHRPTSAGRTSGVVGIVPPREFPREVWEELARQGKIRDAGGGFYGAV
jgi:hypothetical protein